MLISSKPSRPKIAVHADGAEIEEAIPRVLEPTSLFQQ